MQHRGHVDGDDAILVCRFELHPRELAIAVGVSFFDELPRRPSPGGLRHLEIILRHAALVFLELLPPRFTMDMQIQLLDSREHCAGRRANNQSRLSRHYPLNNPGHCVCIRKIIPISEAERVSSNKTVL